MIVPALYLAPLLLHAGYLAVTLPRAANRLESIERISTVSIVPERFGPVAVAVLMGWAYLGRPTPPTAAESPSWSPASVPCSASTLCGRNSRSWSSATLLVSYPANAWVLVLCPLAIAVAVLRSQLFDITVVMRRSLIALGLAAGLSAVYVLGLWVLGPVSARQLPAFLLGIAAAAFGLSTYRWLRSRVERRMYGSRGIRSRSSS